MCPQRQEIVRWKVVGSGGAVAPEARTTLRGRVALYPSETIGLLGATGAQVGALWWRSIFARRFGPILCSANQKRNCRRHREAPLRLRRRGDHVALAVRADLRLRLDELGAVWYFIRLSERLTPTRASVAPYFGAVAGGRNSARWTPYGPRSYLIRRGLKRVSLSKCLLLRELEWCPGAESNHRHRDFQSWSSAEISRPLASHVLPSGGSLVARFRLKH